MAIYQNQIIQMKITDFDLMKSVIVIEELATKLSSLTTVYSFLQKYDRLQESDSRYAFKACLVLGMKYYSQLL